MEETYKNFYHYIEKYYCAFYASHELLQWTKKGFGQSNLDIPKDLTIFYKAFISHLEKIKNTSKDNYIIDTKTGKITSKISEESGKLARYLLKNLPKSYLLNEKTNGKTSVEIDKRINEEIDKFSEHLQYFIEHYSILKLIPSIMKNWRVFENLIYNQELDKPSNNLDNSLKFTLYMTGTIVSVSFPLLFNIFKSAVKKELLSTQIDFNTLENNHKIAINEVGKKIVSASSLNYAQNIMEAIVETSSGNEYYKENIPVSDQTEIITAYVSGNFTAKTYIKYKNNNIK